MVSGNLLLKILGGITVVGLGVAGTYLLFSNSSDAISKEALKSTKDWDVTSTPDKVEGDNTPVEIQVQWKEKDKSWTCKIQGKVDKHSADNTLEIKEQATTLKKKIGINEDKTRDTNVQQNFKTFIESCRKHKVKSTKTAFEGVVNLGSITPADKKYKFKEEDLKKLYDGTGEIFKKLNITKTELNKEQDINESDLKSMKFEGKNNFKVEASSKITLKIEEGQETKNYPEGLKFTLKSDKEIKHTINNKEEETFLEKSKDTAFKIKINGEVYSLEKSTT